jgi:hypothetical protein
LLTAPPITVPTASKLGDVPFTATICPFTFTDVSDNVHIRGFPAPATTSLTAAGAPAGICVLPNVAGLLTTALIWPGLLESTRLLK